jgi:putative sigma-54 modulation protein
MNVRMTARRFDLTEGIKKHIQERSDHFGRLFNNIVDVRWLLEVENHRHTAEATARVFGSLLTGRAEATDLRAAIDEAASKMETQLRKYKGRLKGKDPKAITAAKVAAAASEDARALGDEEEE